MLLSGQALKIKLNFAEIFLNHESEAAVFILQNCSFGRAVLFIPARDCDALKILWRYAGLCKIWRLGPWYFIRGLCRFASCRGIEIRLEDKQSRLGFCCLFNSFRAIFCGAETKKRRAAAGYG